MKILIEGFYKEQVNISVLYKIELESNILQNMLIENMIDGYIEGNILLEILFEIGFDTYNIDHETYRWRITIC